MSKRKPRRFSVHLLWSVTLALAVLFMSCLVYGPAPVEASVYAVGRIIKEAGGAVLTFIILCFIVLLILFSL